MIDLISNYKDYLYITNGTKKKLNDHYIMIKNNYVHKNAIINWDYIKIGKGNIFGPMCVIGGAAQAKYSHTLGKIKIGNDNIFSEFCVVTRPSSILKKTIIGDRNHFMSNSTVHHDCIIENDVVICSNVSVAGNVMLMNGANLGQNSSVHQFQIVGSYSILGMNSCITKRSNIIPGRKYVGCPCREISENTIGLERFKISLEQLKDEILRHNKLRSVI